MFILMETESNNFLKSIKIDGEGVRLKKTRYMSQAMVLDNLDDCTKLFEIGTLPLKRFTWTVFKLDAIAMDVLKGSGEGHDSPKLDF